MTRVIAVTARLAALHDLAPEAQLVFAFAVLQFGWLNAFMGSKIALVNLLPSMIFLSAWILFVSGCFADSRSSRDGWWRTLFCIPAFVLTLRIPLTVSGHLFALNWAMLFVMAGFVVYRISRCFSEGQRKFLVIAGLIVLCNAAGHLGLNSPYTYTFRLMNGLASAYRGVDNNGTWECAFETPAYCVHCDARHAIASEKIFTETNFNPSYSVMLRRFFYGYLGSLIGLAGNRYIADVCLNVFFWFLACAAVYRMCVLTNQSERVAAMAMLCCASAWGFVDMVGQPVPYLLAFAMAPVVVWATLELLHNCSDRRTALLMPIIILSTVAVYDAYQLILVSAILLCLHRQWRTACVLLAAQVTLPAVWKLICFHVLGTAGNISDWSSGDSIFRENMLTWWQVVRELNFPEIIRLSLNGMEAYLDGNLIVAALAAWLLIFARLANGKAQAPDQKLLLKVLTVTNVVVLLATIFVAPFMTVASPTTGKIPRYAFYSYPINLVAFVLVMCPLTKRFMWIAPVLLLILANIDITGLASIPLLFDYGKITAQWK